MPSGDSIASNNGVWSLIEQVLDSPSFGFISSGMLFHLVHPSAGRKTDDFIQNVTIQRTMSDNLTRRQYDNKAFMAALEEGESYPTTAEVANRIG